MKMYDKHFAELVEGKRIAIVGPSASIVGTKQGSDIDAYDVIVRVNKSIPLNTSLSEDIGSRTDVLYNGLDQITKPTEVTGNFLDMDACFNEGVKCFVTTCLINKHTQKNIDYFHEKNQDRVPYRNITHHIAILGRKLKASPNSGLIAITDMLEFDIKELYITGMDFYRTFYHDGYTTKHRKINALDYYHNLGAHMEYVANIYNNDERVKVDKVLQNIFKEEGLV